MADLHKALTEICIKADARGDVRRVAYVRVSDLRALLAEHPPTTLREFDKFIGVVLQDPVARAAFVRREKAEAWDEGYAGRDEDLARLEAAPGVTLGGFTPTPNPYLDGGEGS